MKTVAAAIDFGTSKIVTLLAESGGFNRCDIIGSGTVPYDGYADGENSPKRFPEAIRSSINAGGAGSRPGRRPGTRCARYMWVCPVNISM